MGPYQGQQMGAMANMNMQQNVHMQAQAGVQGYGGAPQHAQWGGNQAGDYLSDFEGR